MSSLIRLVPPQKRYWWIGAANKRRGRPKHRTRYMIASAAVQLVHGRGYLTSGGNQSWREAVDSQPR